MIVIFATIYYRLQEKFHQLIGVTDLHDTFPKTARQSAYLWIGYFYLPIRLYPPDLEYMLPRIKTDLNSPGKMERGCPKIKEMSVALNLALRKSNWQLRISDQVSGTLRCAEGDNPLEQPLPFGDNLFDKPHCACIQLDIKIKEHTIPEVNHSII